LVVIKAKPTYAIGLIKKIQGKLILLGLYVSCRLM
jgi:hypothetical protein